MPMYIEFDMIVVDYDKESKDKERAENLNQEYDASELEKSFIAKCLVDLSAPILMIKEDKVKYKGEPYDCIQIITRDIITPWLMITYENFLNLYKSIDQNFKFYKVENNGPIV